MIKVSDLTLSYGERKVIEGFSAEIAPATITAIIGANGSGKSTLLAALAGDIAIASGEIQLDGREIGAYSAKALAQIRAIAVQNHQYWMAYTALEILKLGHDKVSQERVDYLIGKLELSAFLNQTVTTLSGGQLQRIEIARALLRELPLVMFDEPFASQDLKSIGQIQELFLQEKAAGRTVVLVAHARREDLLWCDQIIEIEAR